MAEHVRQGTFRTCPQGSQRASDTKEKLGHALRSVNWNEGQGGHVLAPIGGV